MKELLLFAAGLLLAMPSVAEDYPPVPAELAPTHGYVYVAFPKGGGGGVSLRSAAGDTEAVIDTPLVPPALPAAQAFGEWLPAGTYRISGWGDFEWSDGPVFEVHAGRVTDLGSFVPVNVGGYELVLLPVHNAENEGFAVAAAQEFASVLQDPTPLVVEVPVVSPPGAIAQQNTGLGLIANLLVAYDRKVNKPSTLEELRAAKDPAEFLRLARSVVPPMQDEPARSVDGTLYFPADLGQVRKRTPDGQWSNVGMDTLRQILAVEYVDGRLLAGSDDGRIRASADDGTSWTDVRALGPMESVIDIDHSDGTWLVVTTERFDDSEAPRSGGLLAAARGAASVRLRVYLGHAPDFSDLAVSKAFTLTPQDQIGWLGARGQLVGGRYFITVAPHLQRLDLASGQWEQITPGKRIGAHRIDPDTGVLTALWSQGMFSKVYVSSDDGDSWSKIGRPPYAISEVQMDSLDSGWASRWNANAFSGVWETYAYAPGKDDWTQSGEAPFNCRPMRIAKDIPVICIASDSSILGLHDGEWQVEFSAH